MLNIIDTPSPNFNDRPADVVCDTVIIHYTDMQHSQNAIARLCDVQAQVSAHYVIDKIDGAITRLVNEDKRAWHAGVSYWQGRVGLNDSSIGIELDNCGSQFGYHDFSDVQMQSLLALLTDITSRHQIRFFLGHSDIAPTRKIDPDYKFNWRLLAQHGFGLVSDIDTTSPQSLSPKPLTSQQIIEYDAILQQIGYDAGDESGASMIHRHRAFTRHFVPSLIDYSYISDRHLMIAQDILENI